MDVSFPPARFPTGLAAVSFPGPASEPQTQIRLYYQLPTLAIQELSWTGNAWRPGKTFENAIASSSIASVAWMTGVGPHIRVYYQAPSLELVEQVYEGQWLQPNTLTALPQNAPLAAIAWFDGRPHIRVYFRAENLIQEYSWENNRWNDGGSIGNCDWWSRLAATMWIDEHGPQLRVYCQNQFLPTVQEYYNAGQGWQTGELFGNSERDGTLAALSWIPQTVQIRAYYMEWDWVLREMADDGDWKQGLLKQQAVRQSPLAATAWPSNAGQQQRVYYAPDATGIREMIAPPAWTPGSLYIPFAAP